MCMLAGLKSKFRDNTPRCLIERWSTLDEIFCAKFWPGSQTAWRKENRGALTEEAGWSFSSFLDRLKDTIRDISFAVTGFGWDVVYYLLQWRHHCFKNILITLLHIYTGTKKVGQFDIWKCSLTTLCMETLCVQEKSVLAVCAKVGC